MSNPLELDQFPEDFIGRWAVISSESPNGEKSGGEILDYWDWEANSISSSAWHLTSTKIVADVEEHQDMHLITFENNMQLAVLRASSEPEVILVIQYGNGKELMRFLLTQNPPTA